MDLIILELDVIEEKEKIIKRGVKGEFAHMQVGNLVVKMYFMHVGPSFVSN